MAKQFPDVNGKHGAPMGRPSFGFLEDCKPKSVSVFRMRMTGAYDDGGAYWGLPSNVYCARSDDGEYQQFTRASNRIEALKKLEITPDYVHVLKDKRGVK
jgi:hypothetical protein